MMKLSDKGFTLLELVVAVGILLIVITGLLYAFITCILMNEANSQLMTAASDAEYVMEQIKALPTITFTDIDSYAVPAELTNPATEHLRNEDITVDRGTGSTIRTITVTVTWTGRNGRQGQFRLVTRIAKT